MNKAGNGLRVINAKYVASAVKMDQYPPGDLQEFAFIGRSNVGKSSLINSLCNHNGLARTSGQPGKTQTINFFQLSAKADEEERRDFFLVDLPGYGYARTGQRNRKQWSRFIEEYFLKSPRLQMIFLLLDIRHPPMESDISTFRWLAEHRLPFRIIATKADKLSRMGITKNLSAIEKCLGIPRNGIIPFSSSTGDGKTDLLDVIGSILLK
jgi:GTP-binding protein